MAKKRTAAARVSSGPATPATPRLTKAERRAARAPVAPYGWDVVGADGRRISRSLPKADAQAEAARISAATGEALQVVPAKIVSPAVAIAEPEQTE